MVASRFAKSEAINLPPVSRLDKLLPPLYVEGVVFTAPWCPPLRNRTVQSRFAELVAVIPGSVPPHPRSPDEDRGLSSGLLPCSTVMTL